MNIKDRIEQETKGHSLYNVRREEYKKSTDERYNFRVSPTPFKLNKSQKQEMLNIGAAICDYMDACIELYNTDEYVKETLDRGKPDKYKKGIKPEYLFLRPDLILTENGFSICEIETSPFGLGLAEVLNRSYGNEGYDPIVLQNALANYIKKNVSKKGTIAYSDKVKAFSGQMDFLAQEVFSGNGNIWNSQNISVDSSKAEKEVYRAFYLNDEYKDKHVEEFLERPHIYLPSPTPQFEEKALMAFIWDTRYTEYFKKALGNAQFELLRKAIPKTWIVGEEKYVDGGLNSSLNNCQDSREIATLGKSQRRYVLKASGFNDNCSWGESVVFLHKKGGAVARETIEHAMEDKDHLYIMQEFKQGELVDMTYLDDENIIKPIKAKVRITPYFSFKGDSKGELIAVKVTGCENTEYIHAGTSSINTAVIEEDERV